MCFYLMGVFIVSSHLKALVAWKRNCLCFHIYNPCLLQYLFDGVTQWKGMWAMASAYTLLENVIIENKYVYY